MSNRGYFLFPQNGGIISALNPLPGQPDAGWKVEFIARCRANRVGDGFSLLSRYGRNLTTGGSNIQWRKNQNTVIAEAAGGRQYYFGEGEYAAMESFYDAGTPRIRFYYGDNQTVVGTPAISDGSAALGVMQELLHADFNGPSWLGLSWLKVTGSDGAVLAEWDANLVPNAARTAWVSRFDVINGSELDFDSSYESRLYDINDLTGTYDASLPAGTSAEFFSDLAGEFSPRAGVQYTYTLPAGFTPVSATLGGNPIPLDSASDGSATVTFPQMRDVQGFLRFGSQELQFLDADNNPSGATVNWSPAEGYDYKDLTGASIDDQASIFYNWGVADTDYEDAVPPIEGDQIVYDTTYYSNVSKTGIITIADGAPASFTSEAYLVDDDGMQAFTTDSGKGVPAVNPPTVTIETAAQTVTVGEQINVSATASDYDTFQWTANLDGTFENENALTTTFTTAEHGQLTTTATAINADGSRSDSVTHTVEEPIAMGEFTATHNNVPDGPIETVVVNLDTSAVLFNGSKTWVDGKATFSFENLAAGDRLQVTTINEPDGDAGLSVEYAA